MPPFQPDKPDVVEILDHLGGDDGIPKIVIGNTWHWNWDDTIANWWGKLFGSKNCRSIQGGNTMTFKEKMKLVFSNIWEFIGPFVKIFMSSVGKALAAAAWEAVLMVKNDPSLIEDNDKRKAAFEMIVSSLAKQGIQLGINITTSIINAAIEAAVQKAKIK